MYDMTTTWRTFVAAAALLSLAGCGGGGGEGNLFAGSARIELSVGTDRLPVQTGTFVEPVSPIYSTTVIAKAYGADGKLVASGTPITFAMDGGNTYSGALYPQPFEFDETTKSKKSFWNYEVKSAAGQALMIFHAYDRPGTVKITASFTDPATNKPVAKTINITVGSSIATGMPATIYANVSNAPIYVANQGKNDTAILRIEIRDPAGQPIANPGAANVKVELLNPEIGALLQGANGQQGTIVNTITTNGVAQLSLKAGTISGTARLRISADAADNNVENGIAQAIVDDISVSISDGRIAAIALTGPFIDAVRTNSTTLALAPGESFQDGTYLRVISAVATDNLGNPVPNAEIKFSLIDSPISGFPSANPNFMISGTDGDPAEGGNLFIAASGQFTDRGVLRNDRLVLTPNEQGVDRGLISSRIITQVNSATSLLVSSPFPNNNGRNSGAVIPWVIGRAQYGVIGASAYTNAQGVATTFLTYPMTRLGQPALITAEGDNGVSNVIRASYIGMLDYSLTASATEVRAGSSTDVTLCVRDKNNAPIPSTSLNVAGTTATVTVTPSTPVTGANGCATVTINANNYTGTADVPLTFTADGTTAKAPITVKSQGAGTLFVTSATAGNNSGTIVVRLLDEAGNPISGRLVTATGTATPPTATITSISGGTTDNNGNATVTVNYTGNPGDSYTINIEAQGGASRTVTLVHP
ncbi:MAG: hypothetical protein P3W87_007995 [Gammaproteobacteria bacterium]|nr:hypothetical protein [Gammaproteobacteria bacterium]